MMFVLMLVYTAVSVYLAFGVYHQIASVYLVGRILALMSALRAIVVILQGDMTAVVDLGFAIIMVFLFFLLKSKLFPHYSPEHFQINAAGDYRMPAAPNANVSR